MDREDGVVRSLLRDEVGRAQIDLIEMPCIYSTLTSGCFTDII